MKWRTQVAPLAEWLAEAIQSTSPDANRFQGPQTRLTRRHWREALGRDERPVRTYRAPRPQSVCAACGAVISSRNKHCKACAVAVSTRALVEGAQTGRIAARSPDALARRRESSQRQNEALQAWSPADHPSWLTAEVYAADIQPRLTGYTRPAIAAALGVSVVYAGEIRNGTCVPHKRHWLKLAELVGVAPGG